MKLFISGATGYIGHLLAMEAANKGYTVHALVRDPSSPFFPVHPNIIAFRGDILDEKSVLAAMEGCEKVLHAAAIAKFRDKDKSIFYTVNVEGTRILLAAALSLNVKKFVFTSTGAVLGPSGKFPVSENDPRLVAFENDYEISKHWAEQLVKEYCRKGLYTVIVAAPRVYGPGPLTTGNPVTKLIQKVLSMGTGFVPSCKEIVANYAFVDDVVKGHFLAMDKGLGGEKYILGGENISYLRFFDTIKTFAGKKIKLIQVPMHLLKAWSFFHLLINRLVGGQTQISPRIITRLSQNRALSCEKASRQLGYSITPFSEGIRRTIIHLQTKANA
ncbi:MAG TPA: NAD-dependent epimerase/dehydratase family protein [Chitinophagaceae bacterium]